ncbi:MAG: VOC family protein [Vampirovibrionales bacterium]|nr:VOC family protein [Vampirovibrionales bacterium]
MTHPAPPAQNSLTPHLVVDNAREAIDFYKRALRAQEMYVLTTPDGRGIMHAQLQIGESHLFLCDAMGENCSSPRKLGGSPITLHLSVDDADAWYQTAVAAGCEVMMPIQDAFWGDRYGQVKDPYGHQWAFATQQRNLSPEEIQRAAQACCAGGV